jgi:hypothetical protein
MSESDSESSLSGLDEAGLVAEALEDYQEKEQVIHRKKRFDAYAAKEEIVISQESLSNLVLTKKQIAQLKREQKERDQVEKRERTEKQKQQLKDAQEKRRKQLDLRKSKDEEGITLKINKTQIRKVRKEPVDKPLPKVKEVLVSDDEEEEKPRKFQATKPNLDDLELKMKKLEQINTVIETQNPYLAMILQNRNRK